MKIETEKLSEVLSTEMKLPHTVLSLEIRGFFERLASGLAWIWLLLTGVVVLNVVMRYLFGEGRIEFEEIQWHLYAIGFLFGIAVCMDADNHVRVDLFHARMSLTAKAWIELYGLLLLYFPFIVFVFLSSLPFVSYSYASGEVSDAPGGLPLRWLMKSVLPVSMLLLMVAGVGRVSRVCACLFGWPAIKPGSSDADE